MNQENFRKKFWKIIKIYQISPILLNLLNLSHFLENYKVNFRIVKKQEIF